MEKFSEKLILLAFVFLLLLDHHYANAAVADNGIRCTQQSRKLIQAWKHKFMDSKIQRKLRTASSPPAPMLNRGPSFGNKPAPPLR
ncbi:hypothetical protein CTI12_AA125220 [Artemisia annua]|uniref:Uncharacterized protein n=1 Tax=Artemisia annua TaxID=35608 RepID=A0A2U1PQK9_ARTAN|nr:hypothetical protein CTI12_AA125220 [Artemisia annua]